MQGDVIAVYSDTGTKLVSYHYDAWGNATTTYHNGGASTLAANNPIRYRGYYYDTTLQMYYLQSRYYDAKICRFINADGALYHSMFGYNLFAYCGNNPVNRFDPTGNYYEDFWNNYGDPLDYWFLEGAGEGGKGATGNYFGYGTAYYNYSVYSRTAAYDAGLGGYYYGGGGHIGGYTAQFVVGNVSVTDDMATDKISTNNISYNLNGVKKANYVSKRGWDEVKINSAISNGVQGTSINRANGAKCVVYRYPGTSNRYVVIETGTRSVVQLSDFYDSGWIPDSNIIWYP